MPRTLRAFAACSVLVPLAACGGGGPSQSGTYAYDLAASIERSDPIEAIPGDDDQFLMEGAEGEVVLASDHSFRMWMRSPTSNERVEVKGTWSVEGDLLSFDHDELDGEASSGTHTMTHSGDELAMRQEGRSGVSVELVFRRE